MGQAEFYSLATESEKNAVKALMTQYPRLSKTLKELAARQLLTQREQQVKESIERKVENIEMAVRLIQDDEVRAITEYRFIKNHTRQQTLMRWNRVTDRTVDRYINAGIESVANTLKLIGQVDETCL
ncbi:hypothetical protein LQV63_04190 [Paenibacillus profundus]|uniref:ArpU family transcriptional regulator n=1 Tax=Paenibacillus profundus TaxID=1173085 RepID=A0ABS8Y9H6_9BACL|nr:hypothetical protein [Paenibacillus profundus]MCE5168513.1 hypothetical protein [Paenibacillus profundus]